MAGMVVVFVFMFVVISIFSFVLILVRIILNISLLKPLNPAGSEPFLMTTWYRPPQSSPDLFSTFERIIDKIDAENLELHLMGVARSDGCQFLHLETSRKAALRIVELGITAWH